MRTAHLTAIAALTLLASIAQADERIERARGIARTLADRLASIQNVSLRASVEARLDRPIGSDIPVGRVIRGVFEFDASGDRWRKRSFLDPELYRGMDTIIAWDGERYQYAEPGLERLSISLGEPRRAWGLTLPNPLAELAKPFVADDGLEANDVTLDLIRSEAASHEAGDAEWSVEDGAIVGRFPGGVDDGLAWIDAMVLAPGEPMRLERRLRGAGRPLVIATFDDWRPAAGAEGDWPRRLTLDSFDPVSGERAGRMVFTIDALSFEAPAARFTLDTEEYQSVYDSDAEDYIKIPACPKGSSSVVELSRRWSEAPEAINVVDALVELGRAEEPDAFRLAEMTEPEFAAAAIRVSQAEHEALAERVMRQIAERRRLLNAAIEAVVERAQAGDVETARRALDVLDRIAEVSSQPDQLLIGRLIAERLKEQVAVVRAEIETPGGE